ncbi:hypothetical protein [Magnetospirillum sp. ME-1]|uniref:hypothetical protein n=1 Tax=Magnetospirillum sp. ME-1 TaxID=1639348 RepID=UPI00143CC689|nr:hypothetical protein [Magnetospirillum sp. ME-1]
MKNEIQDTRSHDKTALCFRAIITVLETEIAPPLSQDGAISVFMPSKVLIMSMSTLAASG